MNNHAIFTLSFSYQSAKLSVPAFQFSFFFLHPIYPLVPCFFQACLSYFDRTPQGRILNRFSSDVGTVDDSLPFILNIFLACISGLIGVLVITCLSVPLLLTVLLPLTFIFWSIQRIYRGASRDLKRLSRWVSVCYWLFFFSIHRS